MIRKYPSLFLLFFVVGGIVLADRFHVPGWILFLFSLGSILVGFISVNGSRIKLAMVCFALGIGGFSAVHFAFQYYDLGHRHLSREITEGRTYHIFGQIADWPDLRQNLTEITVRVDSLGDEISHSVEGQILLRVTDTSTALQIGDRIEFYGRVYPVLGSQENESGFDYRRYLNLRGIFGVVYLPTLLDIRVDRRFEYSLYAFIDKLRKSIADALNECLPKEAAALSSGFLIGETRNISSDIYRGFRQSGTLHLLAVSGSNVALVLLVFHFALRPFGLSRRRKAVLSLIVLLLFTLLSYNQPSVIRASVMAGLVVAANILERRYDLNNIIALAGCLILLFDHSQLYDIGFQLSFATAWGLVFVMPPVMNSFKNHNSVWYKLIVFPLMVCLIAQLFSTPIVLYYFGQAPIFGLLANLVIVPLSSVAVVGILIVLIGYALFPFLGIALGALLAGLFQLLVSLVMFFGQSNWPMIRLNSSSWFSSPLWVIVIYGLLVAATFAITSRLARRFTLVSLLIFLNISFVVSMVGSFHKGEEKLYLVNVPGGIAGLRMIDGGKQGDLIITGLSQKEYSITDRILIPWIRNHGIERINRCFILSASHGIFNDIFNLIDSMKIEVIYFPGNTNRAIQDFSAEKESNGILNRFEFFPNSPVKPCDSAGISIGSDGLQLCTGAGSIWFSHGLPDKSKGMASIPLGKYFVVGGVVDNGPTCDSIMTSGVETVICSKIAQGIKDKSKNVYFQSNYQKRPSLVELSRYGEISFDLSDSIALSL
jgi:competence protein ComEC